MAKSKLEKYENSRIAVDAVIFTIKEGSLHIYLNTREKDPDLGKLELLGGLILPDETAEETLLRKIKQIIPELKSVYFEQFHTFTNPKRDPRVRTVSIGFMALVSPGLIDDWTNWHVTENIKGLAFDHFSIFTAARKRLRSLTDITIAKHLLPKLFRLNELHQTMELLNSAKYDNRNFRRMALASEKIIETDKKDGSGASRPAVLYCFK